MNLPVELIGETSAPPPQQTVPVAVAVPDDDATTEEEQRALEERILAAQQNREPADWAVLKERPVRQKGFHTLTGKANDLLDMKDPYGMNPQVILDQVIQKQLYDSWQAAVRDKMWKAVLSSAPVDDAVWQGIWNQP